MLLAKYDKRIYCFNKPGRDLLSFHEAIIVVLFKLGAFLLMIVVLFKLVSFFIHPGESLVLFLTSPQVLVNHIIIQHLLFIILIFVVEPTL